MSKNELEGALLSMRDQRSQLKESVSDLRRWRESPAAKYNLAMVEPGKGTLPREMLGASLAVPETK